jgi:hypothetical protein
MTIKMRWREYLLAQTETRAANRGGISKNYTRKDHKELCTICNTEDLGEQFHGQTSQKHPILRQIQHRRLSDSIIY